MKNKKPFLILTLLLTAFVVPGLRAQSDNTKTNTRDRSSNEQTAGQQRETTQDRAITKKIRRAITADKSLSHYAHNVKIITVAGMVTLKGPVRSEEEKRLIEEKAVQVVGEGKVNNRIDVAPEHEGK